MTPSPTAIPIRAETKDFDTDQPVAWVVASLPSQ
jgi:hypothetical protein